MYYLCIELLGNIIVLSECRCRAWVCCGGGGVCRLAGCVCLGETHVSAVCLDVLCAVIFRLGASCFLPVVSARCASPRRDSKACPEIYRRAKIDALIGRLTSCSRLLTRQLCHRARPRNTKHDHHSKLFFTG